MKDRIEVIFMYFDVFYNYVIVFNFNFYESNSKNKKYLLKSLSNFLSMFLK